MSHPSSFAHPSSAATLPPSAAGSPSSSGPAKAGRPSRRSPELMAAVCEFVQTEGLSDSAAGSLVGVSTTSLSRWKQDDEEFALRLETARAQFELKCLREVQAARKRDGTGDWRAYAWLLQNSSADGYRRPSRSRRSDATGSDGVSPSRETATVSLAEVDRLVRARLIELLPSLLGAMNPEAADETTASIPEIPEIPEMAAVTEDLAGEAESVADESRREECANVPDIPETPAATTTRRLSRRARRAEERRLAKEMKTNA
jgi:hypothetical protein